MTIRHTANGNRIDTHGQSTLGRAIGEAKAQADVRGKGPRYEVISCGPVLRIFDGLLHRWEPGMSFKATAAGESWAQGTCNVLELGHMRENTAAEILSTSLAARLA